jgi:hypothetical protein
MALVGDQLGPGLGDLVTGAVVNVRGKSDKLAVWAGEGSAAAVCGLGARLAGTLGVQDRRWGKVAEYRKHQA